MLDIFHLGLCQKLETCGNLLTNQTVDFSLHENLDSPKTPKYGNTFYLSRHAKSSLTSNTGFMSSNKEATKGFRFWGVLVLINMLSVPCNWIRLWKSQEVFLNMESSRFSKPGFPITTNLMSSFKVSIYCFLLEIESLIRKLLNFYRSLDFWWTRVSRKCF